MNTQSLILGAGIGAGALYLLTKNNDGVSNVNLPVVNKGKYIDTNPKVLAGLGARQSCCRWINMGGYSVWVCGPGLCNTGGGYAPSGGKSLLGDLQTHCHWVNMGNGWQWVCFRGQGGARVTGGKNLLGAASSNANDLSLELAPVANTAMDFVKTNWYWLAVIAYLAFKK